MRVVRLLVESDRDEAGGGSAPVAEVTMGRVVRLVIVRYREVRTATGGSDESIAYGQRGRGMGEAIPTTPDLGPVPCQRPSPASAVAARVHMGADGAG